MYVYARRQIISVLCAKSSLMMYRASAISWAGTAPTFWRDKNSIPLWFQFFIFWLGSIMERAVRPLDGQRAPVVWRCVTNSQHKAKNKKKVKINSIGVEKKKKKYVAVSFRGSRWPGKFVDITLTSSAGGSAPQTPEERKKKFSSLCCLLLSSFSSSSSSRNNSVWMMMILAATAGLLLVGATELKWWII